MSLKRPALRATLAVAVCVVAACAGQPSPSLSPAPSPIETALAAASPTFALVSHEPTALPAVAPTPSAAQTRAVTPTPVVSPAPPYAHQWLRLDNWSPDGAHLIVDDTSGHHVLDASGSPLWGFPAWDVGWLDSSTIAAAGTGGAGAARETVRIYDITGKQVGADPTVFESLTFAPDHHLFAGVYPATGDLAQGERFSIWDGTTVSAAQAGNPLVWSRDASRLAILLPPWSPAGPGMDGRLAIVDAAGNRTFTLDGWFGTTIGDYEFSPDRRYLAACLAKSRSEIELGTVVDTQTGHVTELGGNCAFTWSEEAALYAPANPDAHEWLRWMPTGGGVPIDGVPADAAVIAAPNGNLAIWSESDSSALRLIVNGKAEERRLPGGIWGYQYVLWRPDGQALAVVYARSGSVGMGDFALAILSV